MGFLVDLLQPILFMALNNCETKKLVIKMLRRYAKSTDNTVDDVLVNTVRAALMKGC